MRWNVFFHTGGREHLHLPWKASILSPLPHLAGLAMLPSCFSSPDPLPPAQGSPEVLQDQPLPLQSAVSPSLAQPGEAGGRSFQAGKS